MSSSNFWEWQCKACKQNQPHARDRCRNCGADCPDELRASTPTLRKHSDWLCRHCHVRQFGYNAKCRTCGVGTRGERVHPLAQCERKASAPLQRRDANLQKQEHKPPPPPDKEPELPQIATHRRKRTVAPPYTIDDIGVCSGDWVCLECNEIQLAGAALCRNKCGTKRPRSAELVAAADDDNRFCLLCHERYRDSAFLHDKHAHSVACMACACMYLLENRPCPICQCAISTVVSTLTY